MVCCQKLKRASCRHLIAVSKDTARWGGARCNMTLQFGMSAESLGNVIFAYLRLPLQPAYMQFTLDE